MVLFVEKWKLWFPISKYCTCSIPFLSSLPESHAGIFLYVKMPDTNNKLSFYLAIVLLIFELSPSVEPVSILLELSK